MTHVSLAGNVYAIIAHGDDTDRGIAVALAEAGADIAIATIAPDQEFAIASIANEVWAIGREQFAFPLDATNADHIEAFANEVVLRLGHCDGVLLGLDCPYEAGQSFLAAVPTASLHWLAVENIGEGAIEIRHTPEDTATAVLATLA